MVVCIAIGNTLREDDGVAHYALQMIAPCDRVRRIQVFQLAPELACEIASADLVCFLDADPSAEKPVLAPIETDGTHASPMAHCMNPSEVVAIAQDLYAFAGKALLCRIPAKQFGYTEELTADSKAAARTAAQMITEYLARHANNNDRLRMAENQQ
jgi:hydrogenase maturation protease